MVRDLLIAIEEANDRDEVRAIVLTGEGKAFCAGIDMSGGGDTFAADSATKGRSPKREKEPFRDISGPVALALYRSRKPVVAAVNGAAVGVGATMTLPADVRIASSGARFSFPFARRGIAPDACSSWFLPRVVGISRAVQWSLGGQFIDADTARASGLIQSVHAPEDLLDAARDEALKMVVDTAPVSVAVTRRLMWRMLGESDPAEAHRWESLAIESRGTSHDAREGIAAFMAKRTPDFPDRVSTDLPPWFREWDPA